MGRLERITPIRYARWVETLTPVCVPVGKETHYRNACENKIRYATKGKAKGNKRGGSVYRCVFCRFWHYSRRESK